MTDRERLTQEQLAELISNPPSAAPTFDNRLNPIGGLPPLDATPPTSEERLRRGPRTGGPPGGGRLIPTYFEYDQWSLFAGKSPEWIVGIQQQMVAAGLVDATDLTPGYWDAASATGMRQLLTEANAAATDWRTALNQRMRFAAARPQPPGPAGRRFVAPTYLAPDYATLAQASKNTFEQLVGRPPKDYEMALLADQLAADSRKEYEAQVAAQRAEFTAAGNHPVPSGRTEFTGGATVQGVDPMARLREAIEARYGPEIAAEESEADYQQNLALTIQNLAGITGFVT